MQAPQPSKASLESNKYQKHEIAGRNEGQDWAVNGQNTKGSITITVECLKEHDNIFTCLAKMKASHHCIPQSYKHAIATDPEQWIIPMQVKMNTLKAKHTWDLVKLPPGANIMDSMWVFNIKWDGEGIESG